MNDLRRYLEKLEFEPGDVLVVRSDPDRFRHDLLEDLVQMDLGLDYDVPVLVMEPGMDLETMGVGELERLRGDIDAVLQVAGEAG